MDREILIRYIEGNVSDKEVETVVNWLDESDEHVREYMRLHKLHDLTLFNQTDSSSEQNLKKKSLKPNRKIVYELFKVAVIVFIVLGVKFLVDALDKQPTSYQSVYAPAGQRAEVILPDSSKAWLNAKSKITYPLNFDENTREVELEGEAYFDVTHNSKKPFIVRTNAINVKVLGTEFNIIAYDKANFVEVTLLEGSVELVDNKTAKIYRMKKNEKARIEDGKLYVTEINEYDYFKWKDGLLCFDNESVASIMKKLELYFDVNIQMNNTNLAKSHYTGKFRADDGVEQILKVLQLEHQFTYTRNRNINLITIK